VRVRIWNPQQNRIAGSNKLAPNLHEAPDLAPPKRQFVAFNPLLCGRMCTMEYPSNVI